MILETFRCFDTAGRLVVTKANRWLPTPSLRTLLSSTWRQLEAPEITLEPSYMSVSNAVQTDDGPVVWPQSRVDAASKMVTSYLRHGTKDQRYNFQGTDGYVRVNLLVQLPVMKSWGIDKQIIELILRCFHTGIAADATRMRIRAFQGQSLPRYNADELYKESPTLAAFRADTVRKGNTPDHLVLEISKERTLTQWARAKTLPPTALLRWHTMKALSGTGMQNFGSKNVVLYVFLNVEEVYAHRPKIELHMTGYGRIVTKRPIPASLVTLARKHEPQGTIISNPMVAPDIPTPPHGPPRVRSRGGTPPPICVDYADLPEPTDVITTTTGKELRTGYIMMLSRMCRGTPDQRSRELQMARGKFKMEPCKHEHSLNGCNAGNMCLFLHDSGDEEFIGAEVSQVRHRIFLELSGMGFSLPTPIRYEIGEISRDAGRDAEGAIRRGRRPEPIAKQMQRPRVHANSRSPKGSPRGKGIGGKGKGKGDAMELADDPRLRDHTTGDEEPSDQEVSAHNEDKENDILFETKYETMEDDNPIVHA